MTITEAKQKLVAWARAQLGYTEDGNNYNRYAQGLREAYGWDVQNQPWCDIFVDAGFIACFGLEAAARMSYQPKGAFSALCSQSAQYYKNAGAWHAEPESGDQAFFYAEGGINHTGLVVGVSNGVVYTIEGNSSDAVRERARPLGRAEIAGFGRPDWAAVGAGASGTAAAPAAPEGTQEPGRWEGKISYARQSYTVQIRLLRRGCRGPQVERVQQLLAANGFDPGPADGDFGPRTAEALTAFQRAAGIGADGEWGGESFEAMWNY